MDIRPPAAAKAPFFRHIAVVSGTRRDNGACRALSLTAPCCILGGDVADVGTGSIAPTVERAYTVLIRRSDWKDPQPPQSGDSLTADGYPLLRVASCVPAGSDWSLACYSKGGDR